MKPTLLILACLLCFGTRALAQTPAAAAPQLQPYLMLLTLQPQYQDDNAWGEAEKRAVSEHFARLKALQAKGRLQLAGRTMVKASQGIVVYEAASLEEARQLMDEDPAVKAGIMRAEVMPFSVVLTRESR